MRDESLQHPVEEVLFCIYVYPNGSIHPDGSEEMGLKELRLVTLIMCGG